MKRPDKDDYDFNDLFEVVRFAQSMIKYCDYLESKQLGISCVSNRRKLLDGLLFYLESESYLEYNFLNRLEIVNKYLKTI